LSGRSSANPALAAKLKAEARRAGRPFRDVVNEMLRRGLAMRRLWAERQGLRLTVRDLGNLKPGLSLDNVTELVEQLERPLHR
jgi:hypothetical protein